MTNVDGVENDHDGYEVDYDDDGAENGVGVDEYDVGIQNVDDNVCKIIPVSLMFAWA